MMDLTAHDASKREPKKWLQSSPAVGDGKRLGRDGDLPASAHIDERDVQTALESACPPRNAPVHQSLHPTYESTDRNFQPK